MAEENWFPAYQPSRKTCVTPPPPFLPSIREGQCMSRQRVKHKRQKGGYRGSEKGATEGQKRGLPRVRKRGYRGSEKGATEGQKGATSRQIKGLPWVKRVKKELPRLKRGLQRAQRGYRGSQVGYRGSEKGATEGQKGTTKSQKLRTNAVYSEWNIFGLFSLIVLSSSGYMALANGQFFGE